MVTLNYLIETVTLKYIFRVESYKCSLIQTSLLIPFFLVGSSAASSQKNLECGHFLNIKQKIENLEHLRFENLLNPLLPENFFPSIFDI